MRYTTKEHSITDSLLLCDNNEMIQSYTFNNDHNSQSKTTEPPPSITLHSTATSSVSVSSGEVLISPSCEKDEFMLHTHQDNSKNNNINYQQQQRKSQRKRLITTHKHTSKTRNTSSVKHALHRHLSLLDLISIGVASTVGSGIFVLCGLIARDFAGPSTFICWAIAGLSCCASGLCYAELGGKFAVSGSTYSYVKLTMGELPAVAAGACITLEYIVTASAVARSWGDKVAAFIITNYSNEDESDFISIMLTPGYGINPMAFLVSLVSVSLLLLGVKESKHVTNVFTLLKIALITLMSIVSLSLMKRENLFPLLPKKFGLAGILRGSTSSFFGYIGFDEICCMGGEVVNPNKNLPRAVMGTISLVTVLYIVAAIGLVGMVPYQHISVTSGFPDGFRYRGYDLIAQITALGEIITLPIVVMVTIMAQPRLQFAMAQDGLLPPIFSLVDETGNLFHGTLIAGIAMIVIATCVPFTSLNDLISVGVLTAFTMTCASVVLLRCQNPKDQPSLLKKSLVQFNCLSLTMGLLVQICDFGMMGQLLTLINALMLLALVIRIGSSCPKIIETDDSTYFQTPWVPYLPLIAQFLNCYLIGQLGLFSIILLVGYIGTAILLYTIFVRNKYTPSDSDSNSNLMVLIDQDL